MSVSDVAKDANMVKNRGRWILVLAALVAMALVAGGWAWWTDRRYKAAMEEIEADIVTGRYAIACRNLDTLLSWRTDWNGGITYLLGSCELARGRSKAAADAWRRSLRRGIFGKGDSRSNAYFPRRRPVWSRRATDHGRGGGAPLRSHGTARVTRPNLSRTAPDRGRRAPHRGSLATLERLGRRRSNRQSNCFWNISI